MAKEIKDITASIRARLINLAKENREAVQSVFVRYGVERFLFRLSRSEHKDKFLLKGAALFAFVSQPKPQERSALAGAWS